MRRFVAHAPGKAAVLGEYAVLLGAPALVLAVDRRCRAQISAQSLPSSTADTGAERAGAAPANRLEVRLPGPSATATAPGASTGVALVDLVRGAFPGAPEPWHAVLDSADFFVGDRKLGLGSSAAAICAFAAAYAAFAGAPRPGLAQLIALHRAFQGGAGSGLDIAAALHGGLIEFRLASDGLPRVGSVPLPKGVGFAGIFAGQSASTPNLLARYHTWRAERPAEAAEMHEAMERIAEEGCAAGREGDGEGLVQAVGAYGRALDALGAAIGAGIVTAEHRAVMAIAARFGVTYKVSGAGGGDLGIGVATDAAALAAFERATVAEGFEAVALRPDLQGTVVEERVE